MTYIALYRTWRPKKFNDLVGQLHVSKTLKNALLNNRVAHAYLFTGPRGTGKTSSAKILAKAVNCLSIIEGEPCNQCDNCLAINAGNFLDVFEIDAASNRGIDEIRDIRDKVKFAPSQGKCKVYIIDEVHMLTPEAFNALLKTLEEPPDHVLFILATTEPQKIPLTILSRCQRFDFRQISDLEIKKHLLEIVKEIKINITDSALTTIARKAGGGMRDAISILDQCIAYGGNDLENHHVEMVLGILGEEQLFGISEAMINRDISKIINKLNEYLQSGKDIKQILRDLIGYFRQILILKISKNEELLNISGEMEEKIKEQANKISLEYLGNIIAKLSEMEKEMRFSSQPQILLEMGLVELTIEKVHTQQTTINHKVIKREEEVIKTTAFEGNIKKTENLKVEPTEEESGTENVAKNLKEANFEHLKRQWPEVLEEVKQIKITTHAFLIPGIPIGIKEGYLELLFKEAYKFHLSKINDLANRELIEKAIAKTTGMSVKLKCISDKQPEEGKKTTGNTPSVQKALELFGGGVVEIKD